MNRLCIAVLLLAAVPARGQFRVQGDPFSPPPNTGKGLENARIFRPGPLGTPGKWEVRGDGSGPVIVGDDVYVPGAPGQRGSWASQWTGDKKPEAPSRSSAEILQEVERELERKRQEEEAAAAAPPPPPALVMEELAPFGAKRVLETVESEDLSRRASALASLPATELTTSQRKQAIGLLTAALDDSDLRIVALAARSLGRMGVSTKLVSLLNLDDEAVLMAACEALSQAGKPEALSALDSLAAAREGEVAAAAAKAAANIRARRP